MIDSRFVRQLQLCISLLLVVVVQTTAALANMAAPWHSGVNLAEPFPELQNIRITREDLHIDLRQLATAPVRSAWYQRDTGIVPIEAIYNIENSGKGREVDLVFIAPALTTFGSGVWLDGRYVVSALKPLDTLPATWSPPASTPLPDDGKGLSYNVEKQSAISFSVYVAPGKHCILVRYRAEPATYSGNSVTAYWQLAYILSPARNWQGLDTLSTWIYYPKGWEITTKPALHADQPGIATASWHSIPGDAIAITLRAPEPITWDATLYPLLGFIGLLAGVSIFGSWFGKRAAEKQYGKRRAVLLAPICALVCSILFFYLYGWSTALPALRAGPQAAWPRGYGSIVLGLFAVLAMWVGALVVFFKSYRSMRTRVEGRLQMARNDVIDFQP